MRAGSDRNHRLLTSRSSAASAISLARENKIPILVFSILEAGGFAKVLAGSGRATLVTDKDKG